MQLSDRSFDISPRRDLSVVDDAKLRQDFFSASRNLLKKIQRLEKEYADFVNHDQVLYQDWYKVTFKEELQSLDAMEKRCRSLAHFHVHLQYVAQTMKVSLEEAYLLLKNEEVQYESGDESWRFVIDKLRSERFTNATKTQNTPSSSERAMKNQAHYSEEVNLNLGDVLCEDDSALSGFSRYSRSVYHYLKEIDDVVMARHLSDVSAGYQLFKESFQIAMRCGDWALLFRIWRVGGIGYQHKLLKPMPSHLKEFLTKTFAEQAAEELPRSLDTQVALRSAYRKIARLLHPDTQSVDMSPKQKEWAAKRWEKAQVAYGAQDHVSLKRLEIICLAEMGDLGRMTLEEIYESSLALNDEYQALRKSLKIYRRHPAWKFSTRRKYEVLKVRIRKELGVRFATLQTQILSFENLYDQAAKSSMLSEVSQDFSERISPACWQ
ncbi:J domain-containing protein [Bdellovibrio sp. ArHS]|uniref:J domain-containing protein n=1 Tax=Bdellovibrio sp. ArHS TaxID=1569284 RepID=UPI000A7EC510|nr:J domain-containing protein [Bdellovibrio sp. ArHS]